MQWVTIVTIALVVIGESDLQALACKNRYRGVCVDKCGGRRNLWKCVGKRRNRPTTTTRKPTKAEQPTITAFRYDTDSSGNVKFEIDHSQDKSISIRE